MTVFTNVSDDVLEPGDPIRSVDILAIKENTNYNHQNTVLEILQEDIFTTSGTFTKATGFDDDDTVMIFLVGGGAGGEVQTDPAFGASGGQSGGCIVLTTRYGDFPNDTFTLTAGAGGNPGQNGGDTDLTAPGFLARPRGGNSARSARGSVVYTTYTKYAGMTTASLTNTLTMNLTSLRFHTLFTVNGAKIVQAFDPDTTNPVFGSNQTSGNYAVFGSGGGGFGGFTGWNTPKQALFNTGGVGSYTSPAGNGGMGGGGGGLWNTAGGTAGAGGPGGMIVRYYRGRVSPFQVVGQIGA